MTQFYDSSALLSQRDIKGATPEIYMVVGNRSAGKTFNFSRFLLRRYLKTGEPFAILNRYNSDMQIQAGSFGADVMQKDPQMKGHVLTAEKFHKFCYAIYMDDEKDPCCFSLSLNDSERIRKNAPLLQKISAIFFDEFQPETEDYLPRELERFQSVHTSIARGGKGHVRPVPIYMASNAVSKINPYFIAFGIHKKPLGAARFVRGDGWVLEQTYIEEAAREQAASGFNRAFSGSAYQQFSQENKYLLDDSIFIKSVPITGREEAVLESDKGSYGLWIQPDGTYYISQKYDPSSPVHVAVSRNAQTPDNYAGVLLREKMRRAYDMSIVRFSDPDSYAAFMSLFDMEYL